MSALDHIAIIMDGNGRWAEARGLPRPLGHKSGVETLRHIVKHIKKLEIKYLTVFSFSTENWRRTKTELNGLFNLLRTYIAEDLDTLHAENVCIRVIGDREGLPKDIQALLQNAIDTTLSNEGGNLTIAFNYGARAEISHAARHIARQVAAGTLSADDINEDVVERFLWTHDLPSPDLLIRTGGEYRISNFLLWQCAYAELYFSNVLWPDFTSADLDMAIEAYHQRERRYGQA